MILTAIIHPEGIAPFMQSTMRYAGNWLVSAIPGARTLTDAYAGRHRRMLSVVFTVVLVGLAFWLYNCSTTRSSTTTWRGGCSASCWSGSCCSPWPAGSGRSARRSPRPDSGGGRRVVRFGPTALVGYVLGWILFPLRDDRYDKLYMPLIVAGLALMIRSIVLRIYRAKTGKSDPMHDAIEAHVPLNQRRRPPSRVEEVV